LSLIPPDSAALGRNDLPLEYTTMTPPEMTEPEVAGPQRASGVERHSGGDGGCVPTSLEMESRDLDGRLWPPGTRVLLDRFDQSAFRVDSPANRHAFSERGRTWLAASLARAMFGDGSVASEVRKAEALATRFMAAVDANLVGWRRRPFPDLRAPWHFQLLPWEPRVADVVSVELKPRFDGTVADVLGARSDLQQVMDWQERIRQTNRLVAYRLVRGSAEVHVIAAFVTPLRLSVDGSPVLDPVSIADLERVRAVYHEARTAGVMPSAAVAFFTVGTPSKPTSDVEGIATGTEWTMVSFPAADGDWADLAPQRFAHRRSMRAFFDALKPETDDRRIERVKAAIDGLIDTGYGGSITVDLLKEKSGYRRSVVRRMMLAIQTHGDYCIKKASNGVWRIERTGRKPDPSVWATKAAPEWSQRLAVGGAIFGVGVATAGVQAAVNGQVNIPLVVGTTAISYVGGWVTRRVRAWHQNKD